MQQVFVQIILQNYFFIALLLSIFVGVVAKFDFHIGGRAVSKFYAFWINFAGATIGWVALYSYLLLLMRVPALDITFADITLLLFALYGIVGFLPRLLINILDVLGRIIAATVDKIIGLS